VGKLAGPAQPPGHLSFQGPNVRPPVGIDDLPGVWRQSLRAVSGGLTRLRRAGQNARVATAPRGLALPSRAFDPWAYRTPLMPHPIERIAIQHPDVPRGLDGLSILHVTDLHFRRRQRDEQFQALVRAIRQTPADIVAFTGDYHDSIGHESAAADLLADLAVAARARDRLGVYGVFGNHDTDRMRQLARRITGITWLENRAAPVLRVPGRSEPLAMRVVGLSYPEDPLVAMLDLGRAPAKQSPRPLTIALAHMPSVLTACADMGASIVIAGHTHAGQIRLAPGFAIHTSSDLPGHMASGILRSRDTLGLISRGVGEGFWPGLRINCPRQLPLYVLSPGPLHDGEPAGLHCVKAW
jgi:predicted MPP superfamily phosphohydrolase